MFKLKALPCSYDYISYDPQCLGEMRMPISPNLQEVYVSNILYQEFSVTLLWSGSTFKMPSDIIGQMAINSTCKSAR